MYVEKSLHGVNITSRFVKADQNELPPQFFARYPMLENGVTRYRHSANSSFLPKCIRPGKPKV